jgi:hypothetical protein
VADHSPGPQAAAAARPHQVAEVLRQAAVACLPGRRREDHTGRAERQAAGRMDQAARSLVLRTGSRVAERLEHQVAARTVPMAEAEPAYPAGP